MDIKVRQAIANLAKQPPDPNLKKPDPLSIICAQRKSMRKTKIIIKKRIPSEKQSEKKYRQPTGHKDIRQQSKTNIKANKVNIDWLKYLPNQRDQFIQMDHIQGKSNLNLSKQQSNPKINQLNVIIDTNQQNNKKSQYIIPQINYQLLKVQLGIGIKQEVKPKIEQKPQILAKQECPNPLLPFPGRAFQQAPPRPPPKRICDYAPTDKVAGLYPWPPPQSDYRRWKSQMRQSRKLK